MKKIKIRIDKDSNINYYIQLYSQLKKKIIEKEFETDSKLWPIRKMAKELNINPATVIKAYDLLEEEDLIYKKVGSGSYVSNVMERYPGKQKQSQEKLDMMEYGQILMEADINFASAIPSSNLFPVEEFKDIINEVIERDGAETFTYQKSQGYIPLRDSIQFSLYKDGIKTSTNNIMAVSGAQQAIDLISKVLISEKDIVVVDEVTYTAALTCFKGRGARILKVPLKKDGMDIQVLTDILKKNNISCLYTMSGFQNPTGISWSQEKKEEILSLAERRGFYIIEDDCLSDMYYIEQKPGSIKSLEVKEERVVYIKSYSKLFMPGLRLGFVVIPSKLLNQILAAKYATDISSNGLKQRAFDLYIRQGRWEKYLNRLRSIYNRRFHLMREKIRYFHPDVSLVYGPRGGLYFWLSLPDDLKSDDLHLEAAKKGVAFLPGRVFIPENIQTPFFRLSFAAANDSEIKKGMDLLIKLTTDYIERGVSTREYIPLL